MVAASAALSALASDGRARTLLASQALHAPHVIDLEIAQALRWRATFGAVDAGHAAFALGIWSRLGVVRYPSTSLLPRVWELRDNISAYDAAYVALAEELRVELVTADGRLARAPGVRCAVTVVPN